MKFPFSFKGEHHCETAVLHCVDFRFRDEQNAFLNLIGIRHYDIWTLPGGVKKIADGNANDFLADLQKVSCGLHAVKKLVLINHADCGAYGGRRAFENSGVERVRQYEDLRKARNIIQEEIGSGLEVIIYYCDLDEEEKELDFLKAA